MFITYFFKEQFYPTHLRQQYKFSNTTTLEKRQKLGISRRTLIDSFDK